MSKEDKLKVLKEHRNFRNWCIAFTIIILTFGILASSTESIVFGIIFFILSIYNIYTYNMNKKDFEKIKNKE